jgi:hypothetical protein
MKVHELIEELQKFNPNAEVSFKTPMKTYYGIAYVDEDKGAVTLEDEIA